MVLLGRKHPAEPRRALSPVCVPVGRGQPGGALGVGRDRKWSHAVSKNRLGPYKVEAVIGKGHNPEAYVAKDGRYVCYVIDAYYIADQLEGPWERREFEFDARDRRIVEGLSNLSFTQREDGSCLMVCRGGGIWCSKDGLGPWEQITQGSNYPQGAGAFSRIP